MVLAKLFTIGVVVFTNDTALDFVGPSSYLELLQPGLQIPTKFYTIGTEVGQYQPERLVPMYASDKYDQAPDHLDILLISGGPGSREVIKNKPFMEYIRDVAENSTNVLSVCTGAEILAKTGLLDNRSATTNKMRFDEIAGEFPAVNWINKARWVVDGKFWTSSGQSAGLDMGYAFIAEKFNTTSADRLARVMEYVPNKDPNNDPFAKNESMIQSTDFDEDNRLMNLQEE